MRMTREKTNQLRCCKTNLLVMGCKNCFKFFFHLSKSLWPLLHSDSDLKLNNALRLRVLSSNTNRVGLFTCKLDVLVDSTLVCGHRPWFKINFVLECSFKGQRFKVRVCIALCVWAYDDPWSFFKPISICFLKKSNNSYDFNVSKFVNLWVSTIELWPLNHFWSNQTVSLNVFWSVDIILCVWTNEMNWS